MNINWIGFKTLTMKEVRRFMKVWVQTVFSPLVTTSLYFLVFGVALGGRIDEINGMPYIQYVVPGLVMLSMISNSFLNSSSSLFQSKINGTIVDLLSAPLGAAELLGAYVCGAMIRGLLVGVLVWTVAGVFVGVHLAHPLWALYFSVMVTMTFSFLGLCAATWAEKFDQLSIFPNFVLTPLTFLGGVFYSIDMLPAPWDTISQANPVLYTVNGLRYGLLGSADLPVSTCAWAVALAAVSAASAATLLIRSGYKLRS